MESKKLKPCPFCGGEAVDERDKIRAMHAALYGGAFEVGDVAGLYAIKYQMLVDFLRHIGVKKNFEGLRKWISKLIKTYGPDPVVDAIEQAIDEERATDTKYVESLCTKPLKRKRGSKND